jgi:hypothetical protein
MIYMVECALGPEQTDDVWTRWYADMKPPERLLSVPGFRSAQRFRGIGARRQHYLALYDVESSEVMSSPAYRGIGGGNFLTDVWKPLIQMWQRNLFKCDTLAPRVPQDAALVLVDAATPDLVLPGCTIQWIRCVGLDRTTQFRGLAVATRAAADAVVSAASAVGVFLPRTACMVAPAP